MEKRVFDFSPGPAVLPVPALQQAQRNLVAMPGVDARTWEGDVIISAALPVGLMLTLLASGTVGVRSGRKASPKPVQRRLLVPLSIVLLLLVGGLAVLRRRR